MDVSGVFPPGNPLLVAEVYSRKTAEVHSRVVVLFADGESITDHWKSFSAAVLDPLLNSLIAI
jgi:class 3 adenylate cyclase